MLDVVGCLMENARSLVLMCALLPAMASAQTYNEGIKAGVELVNQLKNSLLSSQYYGWGTVWKIEVRKVDVTQPGMLGAVVGPDDPPTTLTAFSVSYSWSLSQFNIVAWSEPSVASWRDYLFSRQGESEYWAGYHRAFEARWFFVDADDGYL
jgi:hypothetical protein